MGYSFGHIAQEAGQWFQQEHSPFIFSSRLSQSFAIGRYGLWRQALGLGIWWTFRTLEKASYSHYLQDWSCSRNTWYVSLCFRSHYLDLHRAREINLSNFGTSMILKFPLEAFMQMNPSRRLCFVGILPIPANKNWSFRFHTRFASISFGLWASFIT